MALIKCPECGKEISDKAKACPECGYKMKKSKIIKKLIVMGLLVGTMDIATANNTVAIVMANPIAKEMSEDYDITPRKAASLLDTFSCIFQGIIPYGAQMLVAISAVSELGYNITAFQILPKLFYPMFLFVSSLIWIYVIPEGKNNNKA